MLFSSGYPKTPMRIARRVQVVLFSLIIIITIIIFKAFSQTPPTNGYALTGTKATTLTSYGTFLKYIPRNLYNPVVNLCLILSWIKMKPIPCQECIIELSILVSHSALSPTATLTDLHIHTFSLTHTHSLTPTRTHPLALSQTTNHWGVSPCVRSLGVTPWTPCGTRTCPSRLSRAAQTCFVLRCVCVCIYIYVCVCVCVFERERASEREGERERERG